MSIQDILGSKHTDILNIYKQKNEYIFNIDVNVFKSSDNTYINLLSYTEYYKVMKYLIAIHKLNNYKIINKNTLDVIYKQDNILYTISILDNYLINRYISLYKELSNYNIFIILLKDILNGKKNIQLTKQVIKNNVFSDELNLHVTSYEQLVCSNKEIDHLKSSIDKNKIIFKLDNKLLLEINDITIQLSKIIESTSGLNFDVYSQNTKFKSITEYYTLSLYTKHHKSQLNDIYIQIEKLMKIIQSTTYIISTSQKENVLNKYRELLNPSKNSKSLKATKVLSIEIKDLNVLYNKYAVTDKADGDHAFIIIVNSTLFIITQNLDVLHTGIVLDDSSYDNTIFDGERMFIKKENRYIFMVFDCLYCKGKSLLDEPLLINRLKAAEEVILQCLVFKGQKYNGNNYSYNTKNISIDNIVDFYKNNLEQYFTTLSHDIKLQKDYLLVRPKYFLSPIGIEENEIYRYSQLFWNFYKSVDYYPYNLDGLVYQPTNQKYYTQNLYNLKWKPPENNSIDFYIEFERDKQTNKIITVFNNLIGDDTEAIDLQPTNHINDTYYRICKLYVGRTIENNKEIPVLFNPKLNNPNHNVYIVNLPVDKKSGNCLDSEGCVIHDKTVVEFYYRNDLSVDERFRWVPIRTRFDKTEQVMKYQQKYGNNESIVEHIWFTIHYPITFNDIEILADPERYNIHRNKKLNMISNVKIGDEVYYSEKNNALRLAVTPQRNFHGMIKTIIINAYCKPEFNNNRKVNVLDVGFGQGSDILKYFNANVNSLVGIEPNYNNIYAPNTGALANYNRHKKRYPHFFPVTVINGDFTVPMDVSLQEKYISDKSPENRNNFNKYLMGNKKYNVISCMHSFHYFLKNQQTWQITCDNINKLLDKNGFLLITCFDARRVEQMLKEHNGECTQYVNFNNEKVIYHSIQKLFDTYKKKYGPGNKINVYNGTFMPEYIPEYLVDDEFIIDDLYKKCNLQLIETDYYENIYNNMKNYILSIQLIEQKDVMRSFLEKIAKYYDNTDLNIECKKMTFLHRYYVFKKI